MVGRVPVTRIYFGVGRAETNTQMVEATELWPSPGRRTDCYYLHVHSLLGIIMPYRPRLHACAIAVTHVHLTLLPHLFLMLSSHVATQLFSTKELIATP